MGIDHKIYIKSATGNIPVINADVIQLATKLQEAFNHKNIQEVLATRQELLATSRSSKLSKQDQLGIKALERLATGMWEKSKALELISANGNLDQQTIGSFPGDTKEKFDLRNQFRTASVEYISSLPLEKCADGALLEQCAQKFRGATQVRTWEVELEKNLRIHVGSAGWVTITQTKFDSSIASIYPHRRLDGFSRTGADVLELDGKGGISRSPAFLLERLKESTDLLPGAYLRHLAFVQGKEELRGQAMLALQGMILPSEWVAVANEDVRKRFEKIQETQTELLTQKMTGAGADLNQIFKVQAEWAKEFAKKSFEFVQTERAAGRLQLSTNGEKAFSELSPMYDGGDASRERVNYWMNFIAIEGTMMAMSGGLGNIFRAGAQAAIRKYVLRSVSEEALKASAVKRIAVKAGTYVVGKTAEGFAFHAGMSSMKYFGGNHEAFDHFFAEGAKSTASFIGMHGAAKGASKVMFAAVERSLPTEIRFIVDKLMKGEQKDEFLNHIIQSNTKLRTLYAAGQLTAEILYFALQGQTEGVIAGKPLASMLSAGDWAEAISGSALQVVAIKAGRKFTKGIDDALQSAAAGIEQSAVDNTRDPLVTGPKSDKDRLTAANDDAPKALIPEVIARDDHQIEAIAASEPSKVDRAVAEPVAKASFGGGEGGTTVMVGSSTTAPTVVKITLRNPPGANKFPTGVQPPNPVVIGAWSFDGEPSGRPAGLTADPVERMAPDSNSLPGAVPPATAKMTPPQELAGLAGERADLFVAIPTKIKEELGLVHPNGTIRSIHYLEGLLQKLQALDDPRIDKEQLRRTRILISGSEEIVGAIGLAVAIGKGVDFDNPLIVISKGLINKAASEGELLAILLHEFSHPTIRRELRSDRVGVGEETGADLAPLQWMVSLGYDPTDMIRVFQHFPSEGNPFAAFFRNLNDVHLTTAQRIENVSTLIGSKRLIGDYFAGQQVTAPDIIQRELEPISYEGFIKRLANKRNFDGKTLTEKIQFLEKACDHLIQEGESYDPRPKIKLDRVPEFLALVDKLPKVSDLPTEERDSYHEKLQGLADLIIDKFHSAEDFHAITDILISLATKQGKDGGTPFLASKRYERIGQLTLELIKPSNQNRAHDIAVELNLMLESIPKGTLQYAGLFPIDGAEIMQGRNKHANRLVEVMKKTQDQSLALAIWRLGCTKPEVAELLPDVPECKTYRSFYDLYRSYAIKDCVGIFYFTTHDEQYDLMLRPRYSKLRSHLNWSDFSSDPQKVYDAASTFMISGDKSPSAETQLKRKEFLQQLTIELEKIYRVDNKRASELYQNLLSTLIGKVDCAVDAEHPIFQFIKDSPQTWRGQPEHHSIMEVLRFPDLFNDNAKSAEQAWKGIRTIFELKEPVNVESLVENINILIAAAPPRYKGRVFNKDEKNRNINYLIDKEILRYYDYTNFKDLDSCQKLNKFVSASEKGGHDWIDDKLTNNLWKKSILNNPSIFLADNSATPSDKLKAIDNLFKSKLTPGRKERDQLISTTQKLVDQAHTAESRLVKLQTVLGSSYTMANSATQGEKFIAQYSQEMRNAFNRDANKPDYQAKILNSIAPLGKSLSTSNYQRLTETLANHLEAQETLAKELRQKLVEKAGKPSNENHFTAKALDAIFSAARAEPRFAIVMLEFLSRNLNEKTLDWLVAERKAHSRGELANIELNSAEEKMRLVYSDMHSIFWNGSADTRAVLVRQLLSSTDQASSKRVSDFILAKLFPKMHRSADKLRFSVESTVLIGGAHIIDRAIDRFNGEDSNSDILRKGAETLGKVLEVTKRLVSDRQRWSYEMTRSMLETADEHERPILLAGLMSSRNSETSSKFADGERLATLLGALGGPFIKFGQAANSHPDTPIDIAVPLGRLKSNAQDIGRVELLELVNKRLPQSERRSIIHVGRVLGNASFYISVEVERRNGSGEVVKEVLSLVKENAEQRALNGFNRIERIIENFVTRNPQYASSAKTLYQLVEHGRQSMKIELNTKDGFGQAKTAEGQYNHRVVQVGDAKFDFEVAAWTAFGPGYRFTKLAEGLHFNDLPTKTPEQKAEKERSAVAMFAVDLLTILKGEEIDHDRHGGQAKVKNRRFGLFDHGGMMLRKPTAIELTAGSEVFGTIFGSVRSLGSSDVIQEVISKASEKYPDANEYLQNLKKSLLALNDYAQHLSFLKRLDVLDAVLASGEVYPLYLQAINAQPLLRHALSLRRQMPREQIVISTRRNR
jgi:hypothetical protein